MHQDIEAINAEIGQRSKFLEQLSSEMRAVLVGQKSLLERLLVALLADGHVLLEGVPGLAKTLAVKTLADCIQAKFQRIQFTPDLLPADLVGTTIYDQKDGQFKPRKGPVFANFILADEINRAPAKVQSALLESMQERQVTIGMETFPLPEPFLVLATQNPIEQEGTYPLPEAQVDRFMLKLLISYPNKDEELQILDRMASDHPPTAKAVINPAEILHARKLLHKIYIDDRIKRYIVDLVFATRYPEQQKLNDLKGLIRYGASPRATIYLTLAAKAHAFIKGRGYVSPEDVKAIALDVLRHRVILTYEAEAEERTSGDVVQQVLDHVEVP